MLKVPSAYDIRLIQDGNELLPEPALMAWA